MDVLQKAKLCLSEWPGWSALVCLGCHFIEMPFEVPMVRIFNSNRAKVGAPAGTKIRVTLHVRRLPKGAAAPRRSGMTRRSNFLSHSSHMKKDLPLSRKRSFV
jgi:hypothetical protein